MVSNFKFWLKGIEEDDYLPYEIHHVYFYVSGYDVGIGAKEIYSELIGDFDFYPLEAQFFEKSYYITKHDNCILRLKLLIEDAFLDKELRTIYKGKQLHIGYLGDKVTYSFSEID